MDIGSIVKSSSQVDYVCQVYGPADVESPPTPEDYAFGGFVRVELATGSGHLVGLIRDTALMNPDFGRLGPRLSPPADLEVFAPDYLSERAVLVSVVAVGQVSEGEQVRQGIPLPAAALGTRVAQLPDEEVRRFHTGPGGVRLAYLPFLLAREDALTAHLLLGVVERLIELFPDQARRLAVLRGNLAWKTAVLPVG
jgi:hypothetical protein